MRVSVGALSVLLAATRVSPFTLPADQLCRGPRLYHRTPVASSPSSSDQSDVGLTQQQQPLPRSYNYGPPPLGDYGHLSPPPPPPQQQQQQQQPLNNNMAAHTNNYGPPPLHNYGPPPLGNTNAPAVTTTTPTTDQVAPPNNNNYNLDKNNQERGADPVMPSNFGPPPLSSQQERPVALAVAEYSDAKAKEQALLKQQEELLAEERRAKEKREAEQEAYRFEREREENRLRTQAKRAQEKEQARLKYQQELRVRQEKARKMEAKRREKVEQALEKAQKTAALACEKTVTPLTKVKKGVPPEVIQGAALGTFTVAMAATLDLAVSGGLATLAAYLAITQSVPGVAVRSTGKSVSKGLSYAKESVEKAHVVDAPLRTLQSWAATAREMLRPESIQSIQYASRKKLPAAKKKATVAQEEATNATASSGDLAVEEQMPTPSTNDELSSAYQDEISQLLLKGEDQGEEEVTPPSASAQFSSQQMSMQTVKNEAVKPEAMKPEAMKPEAMKPEAMKPEAVKPLFFADPVVELSPEELAAKTVEAQHAARHLIQTLRELESQTARSGTSSLFSDDIRAIQEALSLDQDSGAGSTVTVSPAATAAATGDEGVTAVVPREETPSREMKIKDPFSVAQVPRSQETQVAAESEARALVSALKEARKAVANATETIPVPPPRVEMETKAPTTNAAAQVAPVEESPQPTSAAAQLHQLRSLLSAPASAATQAAPAQVPPVRENKVVETPWEAQAATEIATPEAAFGSAEVKEMTEPELPATPPAPAVQMETTERPMSAMERFLKSEAERQRLSSAAAVDKTASAFENYLRSQAQQQRSAAAVDKTAQAMDELRMAAAAAAAAPPTADELAKQVQVRAILAEKAAAELVAQEAQRKARERADEFIGQAEREAQLEVTAQLAGQQQQQQPPPPFVGSPSQQIPSEIPPANVNNNDARQAVLRWLPSATPDVVPNTVDPSQRNDWNR